MRCYSCNKEITRNDYSEYQLKKDNSKVQFCLECANDELVYFDVIKKDCLIDGESKELSDGDKKYIKNERIRRNREKKEHRLIDCNKSVFFFTNKQSPFLSKLDINHQVLRYCNQFTGQDDIDEEEYIQRFRFPFSIHKTWKLNYEDLGEITIILEGYKKEVEQVRKDRTEKWRDRVRKWYHGKITVPNCDLYNCTFGFATYDNIKEIKFNNIYVNYDYICSYSWKFRRILAYLLKEDFNIIDYDEKVNIRLNADKNIIQQKIDRVKNKKDAEYYVEKQEENIKKIDRMIKFEHIEILEVM